MACIKEIMRLGWMLCKWSEFLRVSIRRMCHPLIHRSFIVSQKERTKWLNMHSTKIIAIEKAMSENISFTGQIHTILYNNNFRFRTYSLWSNRLRLSRFVWSTALQNDDVTFYSHVRVRRTEDCTTTDDFSLDFDTVLRKLLPSWNRSQRHMAVVT